MDYKCSHCGSTKTEIEEKANQIGLYCAECGKWIKWLSKDEARVLKHKKTNHDQEIYDKAIRDFAQKLVSRLPDVIYTKDVESMANLVNDVAAELTSALHNEDNITLDKAIIAAKNQEIIKNLLVCHNDYSLETSQKNYELVKVIRALLGLD